MTEKLLTKDEVSRMTTLSKSTLSRLMALKKFPLPVKLSPHRIAWPEKKVLEWLQLNKKLED